MQKWIILIVIFLIVVLTTVIALNVDIETEYTPETEVEEVELRKTIVTLYFWNKDSNEIGKEGRIVDSKILVMNPYEEVINMLIAGPENFNNYERCISENVKVLDTKLEGECLTINFSDEFLEDIEDSEKKLKIFETLNKTLEQFTEVNCIKIFVNGNEVL